MKIKKGMSGWLAGRRKAKGRPVKRHRQNKPNIFKRIVLMIKGLFKHEVKQNYRDYRFGKYGKGRVTKGAFGKNPMKDYRRN